MSDLPARDSDLTDYWEDEDGYLWMEVAAWPNQADAARAYGAQVAMAVIADGRAHIRTQNCECEEPSNDRPCPDLNDGATCNVREDVDCWQFRTVDETDLARELESEPVGTLAWYPNGDEVTTTKQPHDYAPTSLFGNDGTDPCVFCGLGRDAHLVEPTAVSPGQKELPW